MPPELLSNIAWHSLAGAHAKFSSGSNGARRYAKGFSPIIAFSDAQRPDFSALAPFCDVGEHVYCGGWSGPVPRGWHLDADAAAHQMLWRGEPPPADASLGAVRLGAEHTAQVLQLVDVTHPGPFGERTIELGEYYGLFEAGQLVSMAGERFEARGLKEISAVCTHPDFQGRGLARRLVALLIRLELARGLTPFLHVMTDNYHARRIYERMGFRQEQDYAVRLISRA